jgi:hypothetical protein
MVSFPRHNRGCTDGVAAMIFLQLLCELLCESSSYTSIYVFMSWCLASEPGMLAYCCYAVLDPVM